MQEFYKGYNYFLKNKNSNKKPQSLEAFTYTRVYNLKLVMCVCVYIPVMHNC